MATVAEANQIFRLLNAQAPGIDGEVAFKDNDGKVSGKRIHIRFRRPNSLRRTLSADGDEIFHLRDRRQLERWMRQPVDTYLVIRVADNPSGRYAIQWMNVTRHLRDHEDPASLSFVFKGTKLDMEAVYRVRDEFFPTAVAV